MQFSLEFRQLSAARGRWFAPRIVDVEHFGQFWWNICLDFVFFLTKFKRELQTLTHQVSRINHALKPFFRSLGVRQTRWMCQISGGCLKPSLHEVARAGALFRILRKIQFLGATRCARAVSRSELLAGTLIEFLNTLSDPYRHLPTPTEDLDDLESASRTGIPGNPDPVGQSRGSVRGARDRQLS